MFKGWNVLWGFSGVTLEPASESTHCMLLVGAEGFEPPTLCSQKRDRGFYAYLCGYMYTGVFNDL